MSKEKFSYEGIVHSDYKKKVLLKINALLLPILGYITLFLVALTLGITEPRNRGSSGNVHFLEIIGVPELLFWLILYVVVIPYIVIMIISSLSLSAYIRNFSFNVSENNIVIYHGVFTKTKATIPYIRIQNINIVNGVFDRFFKLYTVKIETAGTSGTISPTAILSVRPEGHIPGLKDPNIIEDKINEMIKKQSQVTVGLEDKLFKPEDLAFDNFISYILSKMREGEKLKTRIKELREKAKMSGIQLAEKVGVPIQTIQYLEEGRYNPSLSLAYKIAGVLNCKIEDLFQMA